MLVMDSLAWVDGGRSINESRFTTFLVATMNSLSFSLSCWFSSSRDWILF